MLIILKREIMLTNLTLDEWLLILCPLRGQRGEGNSQTPVWMLWPTAESKLHKSCLMQMWYQCVWGGRQLPAEPSVQIGHEAKPHAVFLHASQKLTGSIVISSTERPWVNSYWHIDQAVRQLADVHRCYNCSMPACNWWRNSCYSLLFKPKGPHALGLEHFDTR